LKLPFQNHTVRFLQKGKPNVHTIGEFFDLVRYNDQEIVTAQAAPLLMGSSHAEQLEKIFIKVLAKIALKQAGRDRYPGQVCQLLISNHLLP
jgi:hypothetical protein